MGRQYLGEQRGVRGRPGEMRSLGKPGIFSWCSCFSLTGCGDLSWPRPQPPDPGRARSGGPSRWGSETLGSAEEHWGLWPPVK